MSNLKDNKIMKKTDYYYLISSVLFLLLQNINGNAASQTDNKILDDEPKKGARELSMQQRDSDTSDETIMQSDDAPVHRSSVAQEIFENACKIIPGVANPEDIRPDAKKIGQYSLLYSSQYDIYSKVNMLHDFFVGAIDHNNEDKIHVALWLLRAETVKSIFEHFYDQYGAASPAEGKELLLSQITQLIEECLQYPGSAEESIEVNSVLKRLNQFKLKW